MNQGIQAFFYERIDIQRLPSVEYGVYFPQDRRVKPTLGRYPLSESSGFEAFHSDPLLAVLLQENAGGPKFALLVLHFGEITAEGC